MNNDEQRRKELDDHGGSPGEVRHSDGSVTRVGSGLFSRHATGSDGKGYLRDLNGNWQPNSATDERKSLEFKMNPTEMIVTPSNVPNQGVGGGGGSIDTDSSIAGPIGAILIGLGFIAYLLHSLAGLWKTAPETVSTIVAALLIVLITAVKFQPLRRPLVAAVAWLGFGAAVCQFIVFLMGGLAVTFMRFPFWLLHAVPSIVGLDHLAVTIGLLVIATIVGIAFAVQDGYKEGGAVILAFVIVAAGWELLPVFNAMFPSHAISMAALMGPLKFWALYVPFVAVLLTYVGVNWVAKD